MRAQDELVQRLAIRRRGSLGGMSDAAFEELLAAVRENPATFVEDPCDQAFLEVASAVRRFHDSVRDDEFLDDDQYAEVRQRRLSRMLADCARALASDPGCVDALLMRVLAADMEPSELVVALEELCAEHPLPAGADADAVTDAVAVAGTDAWDDVFARPTLRLHAALSRAYLDTAHYRLAVRECDKVLVAAPSDPLGVRHTKALALARLEDEDRLNSLLRDWPQGSAFEQLAHAILLYKLDRIGAARRAVLGYGRLVEGGAYALLRPVLVETYMPDRPEVRPFSFDEAMQAVSESDPIVVDVPDFIGWCELLPEFVESARRFADAMGYDW